MRVLIVDDEPPARRKLRRFLEADPDVEVAGEVGNGADAVRAIEANHPDLVFLDVQMPALDGFGVMEALDVEPLPLIIFVTAYDEYAIKAFEVEALDYLLKPFDEERFRQALDRAKRYLRDGRADELGTRLRHLLGEIRKELRYISRIMVTSGSRIFYVNTSEILWIEGAANYVKLHVGNDVHLVRETLDGMLGQLDPGTFVRVHRSHVVNLDYVHELYHWSHGDYVIVLKDGTEVKLSRRYRDQVPGW